MTTPPQSERRTDTPRRVIRALFEFRKAMLGFFVVFFVFLMLIAYNFPKIWEAEGKVMVKSGRQNAALGVASANVGVRLDTTMENVVSEMGIMLSEPVLSRVAERLLADVPENRKETFFSRLKDGFDDFCVAIGLVEDLPDGANLTRQLAKKIEVEIEPGAFIINVTYHNQGKGTAVRTVNYLLEEYLKQHTEIHSDRRALTFFEQEVVTKKEELDGIQAQITDFRMSHDGGDLTQQRSLLLQDLTINEQALRSLEGVGDDGNLMQASSLTEHPELASYYQRLLDLELQMAAAQGLDVRAYEQASHEFETTRTKLLEQLQNKKDFLGRRVKDLRAELQEVEKDRAHFEDLLSQREIIGASYRQYMAKFEEERISQAMDVNQLTSVRVLQQATTPVKPYFPNRFVMAILGFLLGIPGAIAFALLRAYFHGRVSTVQDIESELGLPVLASLARLPSSSFRDGLPEPVMKGAKLVLASIDQSGARTVCLASSTNGEGAATMASAVAVSAAQDGRSVTFATPDGIVSDAVKGEQIQVLDLSGMGVAEQKKAVDEAAVGCDLVIMSALPLAGAEGGLYASSAEAAVFVVSGSGVHIEVARRGQSMLDRYCDKVLGAVLTQRRDPIPRLLYRRV